MEERRPFDLKSKYFRQKYSQRGITGMYLIEEGILETQDVNARFINGKPQAIESIYVMKNSEAWDRFIHGGTIWMVTRRKVQTWL
jgi:photosystem II protein